MAPLLFWVFFYFEGAHAFFLHIVILVCTLGVSVPPTRDEWPKNLFSGTAAAPKGQKWRRILFLVDFDSKNAVFSEYYDVSWVSGTNCTAYGR